MANVVVAVAVALWLRSRLRLRLRPSRNMSRYMPHLSLAQAFMVQKKFGEASVTAIFP
jgi:hypothetical protein